MSPCFVVANTHVRYFKLCVLLALETPRFSAGEPSQAVLCASCCPVVGLIILLSFCFPKAFKTRALTVSSVASVERKSG